MTIQKIDDLFYEAKINIGILFDDMTQETFLFFQNVSDFFNSL